VRAPVLSNSNKNQWEISDEQISDAYLKNEIRFSILYNIYKQNIDGLILFIYEIEVF
jgi:hypothetical protein